MKTTFPEATCRLYLRASGNCELRVHTMDPSAGPAGIDNAVCGLLSVARVTCT